MKKNEHIETEVDKTLEMARFIKTIEPPASIYSNVMDRVHGEDSTRSGSINYLQWAAIGLLVLVNAMSYVSFLNSEDAKTQASVSAEVEIENLLSEYQINDFAYNEY